MLNAHETEPLPFNTIITGETMKDNSRNDYRKLLEQASKPAERVVKVKAVPIAPDKTCYCKHCRQWKSKEECAGIACKKCFANIEKIRQHNNARRNNNKGITKDTDSLFIFFSSIFKSQSRNKGTALYSIRFKKVYVDLSKYCNDFGVDIEALTNCVSHEHLHHVLYVEQGLETCWMWDFANIRLTMDYDDGYLGFPVFRGEAYYYMLFETEIKIRKWLKILKKENKI